MTTELTITAATVATLVSAGTSASITLWLNSKNKRKNLDDQLDNLLKIAVQYPYLESEKFTNSWTENKNSEDEKYLRYEVYCVLLFNFFCRTAEHYNFNREKIESHYGIKDWVRLHQNYWKNPSSTYENIDTYDKKFVDLIKNYLK